MVLLHYIQLILHKIIFSAKIMNLFIFLLSRGEHFLQLLFGSKNFFSQPANLIILLLGHHLQIHYIQLKLFCCFSSLPSFSLTGSAQDPFLQLMQQLPCPSLSSGSHELPLVFLTLLLKILQSAHDPSCFSYPLHSFELPLVVSNITDTEEKQ